MPARQPLQPGRFVPPGIVICCHLCSRHSQEARSLCFAQSTDGAIELFPSLLKSKAPLTGLLVNRHRAACKKGERALELSYLTGGVRGKLPGDVQAIAISGSRSD